MRLKHAFHRRSHKPGGSDPITGRDGAIFYDYANVGDWLNVETTGSMGGAVGVKFTTTGGNDFRVDADPDNGGQVLLTAYDVRVAGSPGGVIIGAGGGGSLTLTVSGGGEIEFDASVDSSVVMKIAAGKEVAVQDHLGNTIFRVDENGDLHGKTGKALTFDL